MPVILRLPTRLRWVATSVVLLGAAVAVAACNGDDGATLTPAPQPFPTAETPAPGGETPEIKMLPETTFDRSELTIAADTDVTITADNTDGTHNFAVYNSRDEAEDPAIEPIGQTEIETAPFVDTVTLNLAAGEYFFRCDVHPDIMTGTLIAE